MIQVMLFKDGEPYYLRAVATLEQASRQVEDLQNRFEAWEEAGCPEGGPDDIRHYEGCDVYAQGSAAGRMWLLSPEDEWEEIEDDERPVVSGREVGQ